MYITNWKGSYYKRVRSNDYRNREHGDVVKKVTIQKRRGMRNKAVVFDGKNWVGVEKSYNHVYSFDPKKNLGAKREFKKRTMTRQQQKAMFARGGLEVPIATSPAKEISPLPVPIQKDGIPLLRARMNGMYTRIGSIRIRLYIPSPCVRIKHLLHTSLRYQSRTQ